MDVFAAGGMDRELPLSVMTDLSVSQLEISNWNRCKCYMACDATENLKY